MLNTGEQCGGCGVMLQYEDKKQIGYIPKERFLASQPPPILEEDPSLKAIMDFSPTKQGLPFDSFYLTNRIRYKIVSSVPTLLAIKELRHYLSCRSSQRIFPTSN